MLLTYYLTYEYQSFPFHELFLLCFVYTLQDRTLNFPWQSYGLPCCQMVKELPALQKTSLTLAVKIPWRREWPPTWHASREFHEQTLQSLGSQRVGQTEWVTLLLSGQLYHPYNMPCFIRDEHRALLKFWATLNWKVQVFSSILRCHL